MKKLAFYIVILLLLLAACSGNRSVETGATGKSKNRIVNSAKALNQLVVDDENMKVTLIAIENKSHEMIGEYLEVIFEITNKRDHSVKVQAKEVIFDGEQVDNARINMSKMIAGENSVESVLMIQSLDKKKTFAIPRKLEVLLQFLSFENYDFRAEHHLEVEI